MNSMQLDELVKRARRGAEYARARNGILVLDCTSELRGWFSCATLARDRDTARAAQRAVTWVNCAYDYHRGYAHLIDELGAKLMWGEAS
ncbi:hypothetical protein [Alloalcanivorax xenomutans]|uniref:hypothetical protein n=1 Tax=Alloalcanivorax xenomutans TaxID=1094342 RepID=UPI003BAA36CF